MERDRKHPEMHAAIDISTHTLTWSVTLMQTEPTNISSISTHTLTWSVT